MSRILYISHDADQPRGGVGVLYEHVATLRAHGFDAYIVHAKRDFRYRFGAPDVPVLDASANFSVREDDTLVVPEDYAGVIRMCRDLVCRKVLFCQNHHYWFNGIRPGEAWSDFGFDAYLCVSTPIQQALLRWFGVKASIVRPAIDPCFFTDAPRPLEFPLTVACMPRKGTLHLRLVQGLLATRGFAERAQFSWAEIDGQARSEVAARLRDADIYVATGLREGLGLPPLEAMASGCLVVGFAGGGGRDYASADNGVWVNDEDPWALAEALADTIDALGHAARRGPLLERRAAGQATASAYRHERFERDLLDFWSKR